MISRRRFLASGGATLGAAAAASVVGLELSDRSTPSDAASDSKGVEPFYGMHQGGIATAQQDRLLYRGVRSHHGPPRRRRAADARLDHSRREHDGR